MTTARWDALDVLRGLTIILMLMNLMPGSWQYHYAFLEHVTWEGGTLIDMVAPAFLFCVGAAMPLSLERRSAKGATRKALLGHVLWRGLLLVLIGFLLNLYPGFDWAHVRIPSVLSRIGLCYAIVGTFMLMTARPRESSGIQLNVTLIAGAAAFILVSYWVLLYFVPVPGFGAPRFDPVESWPAVVDRAVIGVPHMFPWWPVDGKVVFDPEGIISTWPACFSVLFGALVGIFYTRGTLKRPAVIAVVIGVAMMAMALLLHGICPIIKNLWTSTFALFSGGFCLTMLGLLWPVSQLPGARQLLVPARIFGENPLLAYIICFLIAPLLDANLFGDSTAPVSLRGFLQVWFQQYVDAKAASALFGVCGLLAIFAVLIVCHRKKWILKL